MAAYDEIDTIIDAWAQATVKKLFTEWADRPARFAYLPGLRPFECFQISIDPPLAGRVAVLARSVDTDDESEFEQRWEGTTDTIAALLQDATDTVRTWVNEKQLTPNAVDRSGNVGFSLTASIGSLDIVDSGHSGRSCRLGSSKVKRSSQTAFTSFTSPSAPSRSTPFRAGA